MLKNYKTSIAALLTLVCIVLNFANVITTEQLVIGTGLLTSIGLVVAKDADREHRAKNIE